MNTKQSLSLTAASGLMSLVVLTACAGGRKEAALSSETVRNVAVVSARRAAIPDYLEATGTVRAAQTSQIASQMMGNIVEVRVHEGDHVVRGQILAVIDDSQSRAALDRAIAARNAAKQEAAAAESEFHLAEATFKRYQDLYEKKSVSPQEFDEIKARFQGAQARRAMSHAAEAEAQAGFAQAETAQAYSRVRAPFDGVVTEKKADAGTLASPGMPLFTLEDPRRYRLEASVDEGDLRLLRNGQAVRVHIDALGDELSGKVSRIVPAADASTRSFLVKVDLPANQHVRSGLFGRALISRGDKSAVLAPRSAVVHRGQLQAVYVVESSGTAALRYVTLGNSYADEVEIFSGLDGGENLIADPANQELAGKKIEARR
jgi:RND family efflux transporter MFP subunit